MDSYGINVECVFLQIRPTTIHRVSALTHADQIRIWNGNVQTTAPHAPATISTHYHLNYAQQNVRLVVIVVQIKIFGGMDQDVLKMTVVHLQQKLQLQMHAQQTRISYGSVSMVAMNPPVSTILQDQPKDV